MLYFIAGLIIGCVVGATAVIMCMAAGKGEY